MEIYEARKIQKFLFNRNKTKKFKRMRAHTQEGKLYYNIFHHITNMRGILLDKDSLETINQDLDHNVGVQIEYINKEINPNIPEGMYMIEFIEVD